MTCASITDTDFKAAKPQFNGVQKATLDIYIALAQVWTAHLPESICEAAQVSVVCHLLTLDGMGTDAASKGFVSGSADMQTIRSGNITLTRFRAASEGAGQSTQQWFAQTPCGRMFLALIRGVIGGPRIAGGGNWPVTAYAKDAWW